MKFFTPDLIARLGSADEAVVNAAQQEWESALEQYDCYWQSIAPGLPESIREFNNLLLHDAVVWSISRQGNELTMVLRKDIPPQDVVVLTYSLVEEPFVDKDALPAANRGPVMDFQYDEFELFRGIGEKTYAQSILFGNGWNCGCVFPMCG